MTDDYASTILTVTPVILVVATAEFQALVKREPRPSAREGLTGRLVWDTVPLVMWNGLVVSRAVVEMQLIMWLATTERPESPELADPSGRTPMDLANSLWPRAGHETAADPHQQASRRKHTSGHRQLGRLRS
jgi:hypothetical protein